MARMNWKAFHNRVDRARRLSGPMDENTARHASRYDTTSPKGVKTTRWIAGLPVERQMVNTGLGNPVPGWVVFSRQHEMLAAFATWEEVMAWVANRPSPKRPTSPPNDASPKSVPAFLLRGVDLPTALRRADLRTRTLDLYDWLVANRSKDP